MTDAPIRASYRPSTDEISLNLRAEIVWLSRAQALRVADDIFELLAKPEPSSLPSAGAVEHQELCDIMNRHGDQQWAEVAGAVEPPALDLVERATEWLSVGGFFNPEMMHQQKSTNLVLDMRDEIQRLRATGAPTPPEPDDIGLSVDMLDVDRLREWARLLLVHGSDISHWGSALFVASKMQILATDLEKTIRDIGRLRGAAGAPTPPDPEAIRVPWQVTCRQSDGTTIAHHAAGVCDACWQRPKSAVVEPGVLPVPPREDVLASKWAQIQAAHEQHRGRFTTTLCPLCQEFVPAPPPPQDDK